MTSQVFHQTAILAVLAFVLFVSSIVAADNKVSYSLDIKPILSTHCFACHGPDEAQREAELRLDLRDVAVEAAIVPGSADESLLVELIASDDPDVRMPPTSSKRPALGQEQIQLIRRWIDQGAQYDAHWAYQTAKRPAVPAVLNPAWPENAIDHFVARKHQELGLVPSGDADRRTLARRLYFDLLGLPPTAKQVDKFISDQSADAYETIVETLLSSEHYGERMAVYWLDLVRYADTNGIHGDNHRDHDLYRDYVIAAFNDNMAFDRFTVEQLAGDLLPDASRWQRIASGYNRLNRTTREGGAQAKEYRAKYAADRVRNASVVWLGSTMGCAECHNHKFDPFTMKDFYSFAAFFADLQETAVGAQKPTRLPTEQQERQLEAIDQQLAPLRKEFAADSPELQAAQTKWEEQAASGLAQQNSSDESALPAEVVKALKTSPAERGDKHKAILTAHFRSISPALKPLQDEIARLEKRRKAIVDAQRPILVAMSGSRREMRVLPRGNWMDDSGEVVHPGVPEFLSPPDIGQRQASRLDLANWLVDPQNPLVARVMVNRLWKIAFGRGLVSSLDDFGAQGAVPSHPELLDWLAAEFVESGWDVKHMLKLMLMSRTYRQSSFENQELRERDPANRWLARQTRFRLDAEMIRDNALSIAGLLQHRVGGVSVKPYQPAGYWKHLNFPKRSYKADTDDNQYRRGLYTYWCRTFLHPSLLAFDAPTREEACVERPRSNTPLQSLVLLNDPTYVEAARAFAARIMRDGGDNTDDRIAFAIREALGRKPTAQEAVILTKLHTKHRLEYSQNTASAEQILSVGQLPAPSNLDKSELAAWTSVARVILNLHETITRN